DGCKKKHKGLGLCTLHYQRLKRGAELSKPEMQFFANPDESFRARSVVKDNGCVEWSGSSHSNGYGKIHTPDGVEYAHRYAWERVNGAIPAGMQVDHTCWNRACVQVSHLRLVTVSQNGQYRSGPGRDSVSGIRNVCFDKRREMWRVRLNKDGVEHNFG